MLSNQEIAEVEALTRAMGDPNLTELQRLEIAEMIKGYYVKD
jgi:hypothetical protein